MLYALNETLLIYRQEALRKGCLNDYSISIISLCNEFMDNKENAG